jgi:hypothetical protein
MTIDDYFDDQPDDGPGGDLGKDPETAPKADPGGKVPAPGEGPSRDATEAEENT